MNRLLNWAFGVLQPYLPLAVWKDPLLQRNGFAHCPLNKVVPYSEFAGVPHSDEALGLWEKTPCSASGGPISPLTTRNIDSLLIPNIQAIIWG